MNVLSLERELQLMSNHLKPAAGAHYFIFLRSYPKAKRKASKYRTQTVLLAWRIKWRRFKPNPKTIWDLHQSSECLWGVGMMLSLLEVLHQQPAPRGEDHTNYGRPAGPQQCCSAVCPACNIGYSTQLCFQQLLSIALMNSCALSHTRL